MIFKAVSKSYFALAAFLFFLSSALVAHAYNFTWTPTAQTPVVAGVRGDGIDFTGLTNSIHFTNFHNDASGDQSISFWYKSSVQESGVGIFTKGNLGGTQGDYALFKNGGVWILRCYDACPNVAGGEDVLDYVVSSQDDGLWHHIVITFSSVEMAYYVDGVYEAPQTPGNNLVGGAFTPSSADLYFGLYYASDRYGSFSLDELALFNTAIDSSAVTTYYGGGDGHTFSGESGLIYYSEFNDDRPTLTTSSASDITTTSVSFNASIDSIGTTNAFERGFEYGTDINYGTTVNTIGSYGIGPYFHGPSSSLNCGTTYHFRSYAINTEGLAYGADQSFATLDCTPTMSTGSASAVNSTSATLSGSIDDVGTGNASVRGFEYGLDTSYGNTINESAGDYAADSYSLGVSFLSCGQTYHFRSYAVNGSGTGVGGDQSFVTGNCAPTLTTDPASSVSYFSARLNGTLSDAGLGGLFEYDFEYGLDTNYGTTESHSGAFSPGPYFFDLTSLSCGTTYHYRFYAINGSGTTFGGDESFITTSCSAPTVTTDAASSLTKTTATLNGNITDAGSSDAVQKGFAYGTSPTLATTIATSTLGSQSGTGTFNTGISGLTCNTTYYSRAYATNDTGTAFGAIVSFITSACAPTVTTSAASSITQTAATLNGNITATGGANATQKGFAYGTSATLATTIATTTLGAQTGTGAFSGGVSGLSCNTTYYARAYATNSGGTGYGTIVSFVTSACAPTVTTSAASSITQTAATLNGNITATGGSDATEHGFAYGTSATLATTIATTTLGSQSGTGAFTDSASGLTCNTTYYARAYATNGSFGYGTIVSFTTSACTPPTVTTDAVSSITQTAATLNGTITVAGSSDATQKGFAYGTSATMSTTIATTTLGSQSGTGAFSGSVSSLTCNTTYYSRAYAINTGGTGFGTIVSFTTSACVPTVTLQAASSITTTSATGNANITVTGGASPTVRGFVYGTTAAYGATTTENGSFSTGAFTGSLTSLTCNTTYHISAYAVNTSGTSTYPTDATFTTSACASVAPTVTTSAASSVTQTAATLNGNITATGGSDATEHGFAYGTSADLSTVISTTTLGSQSGTGAFTDSASGLTCNTTYYARAYATNTGGTGFGTIVSFTTSACSTSDSTPPPQITYGGGGGSGYVYQQPQVVVPQNVLPQTPVENPVTTFIEKIIPIFTKKVILKEPSSTVQPEIIPPVFSQKWSLLSTDTLGTFVLAPLPDELGVLSAKFPQFKTILSSVGVRKITDIEKLRYSTLSLPSFSSAKDIPTEVIFAQSGKGNIDISSAVQVTEGGVIQQKITTLSGSNLKLSVRPEGKASAVSGYIAFKQKAAKTVAEIPLTTAVANALFGHNAFAQERIAKDMPERKLIVQAFEYTDPDGDGVYTAEVKTPQVEGEYEVVTLITYNDPKKGTREMHLIAVVDPEGYVFENNGGNETRLPDVTVTLWKEVSGSASVWNAQEYNQENPQITDKTGRYSFLVPPGEYYITAEAKGHAAYTGGHFTVSEGKGIHFNIELQQSHEWLKYLLDWRSVVIIVCAIIAVFKLLL